MARSKAAMGILAWMALVAIAFPIGASAEPAQLSPTNNTLYLHYNMTYQQGWMNVNVTDTGDDGWYYHGAIFGFTGPNYVRFIMMPALNGSLRLITDPARIWTAHIGYYEGLGRFVNMTGALTVGEYSSKTGTEWNGSPNFTFVPGVSALEQKTAIIFNLTFIMRGGDFVPNDLHLLTGGNSTLAIPIVAVDSDGDGHDDTRDAFPADPARWEKPGAASAKGFLPGFDGQAALVSLGVFGVVSLCARRKMRNIH
jgi:hypothetical protein